MGPHAVIGAGVVGLSIAWELCRRGEEVIVIDPRPGQGASWAAAGMIAPVSEQVPGEDALAVLTRDSAARYSDFLASLPGDDGACRVGYRDEGTLVVGMDSADGREVQLTADRLAAATKEAEQSRLTVRQARSLEPGLSPRIGTVLSVDSDQQVDPRLLTRELLNALETSGARILRSAAEAVEANLAGPGPGGFRITLEDATAVEAEQVILACGLGGPRTPAAPCTPLHAEWGDVLRVRPLDPEDCPQKVIRAFVRGRQVYVVPRQDGSVVVGASVRLDGGEQPHLGSVLDLLADAVEVCPGLREAAIEDLTTRPRPATRDHLPHLGAAQDTQGRVIPGLHWATGFDRHGVLLSPWAAHVVADAILRSTPYPETTDPYRITVPARTIVTATQRSQQ